MAMDDPKELLNQLARDRRRVAELLAASADGTDDQGLEAAVAAMMGSTFDAAESLTELVVELLDRLAPTLLDLRERVERLEAELLPPE